MTIKQSIQVFNDAVSPKETEKKNNIKTIDLTPNDQQYKYLLNYIVDRSTNKTDVVWAKNELKKWENK
tara:strand:- start:364 stop:567 length:204 start_codon:yes stop_codon:yes gene_type:complete